MMPKCPLFFLLIKREYALGRRAYAEGFHAFIFFIMVVTFFPFTLDFSAIQSARMAPGIIWIAAVLAALLVLPHLFRQDFEDGSLAQMLLSPRLFMGIVVVKIILHGLAWIIPLLLVTPLLGWMLGLQGDALWVLMLTLLLGTPTVYLLGAFVAALSVGLRKANVLIPLTVLPLFIPVLIFSCGSVQAVVVHTSPETPLLLLSALFVLAVTFLPMGIAAALRIALLYSLA